MKRFFLILLLLLGIAMSPAEAPGCGPFFQQAQFSPKRRPAVPEAEFQAGNLGVVHGSYWLQYLIPAWRYFDRKPIATKPRTVDILAQPPRSAWENWNEMRARVVSTGEVPQPNQRRIPSSDWQSYLNCTDSSFSTAAATLKARLESSAPAGAPIKAWVKAQDTVFSNCAGGRNMPDAPEAGLPPLFAADRRYQIASAHFYAGDFAGARKAFLAIGSERESPWRNVAPYLAARASIRQATLTTGEGIFDEQALVTAEEELKALASTSPDGNVRRWAEDLAEFVATKLRPGDRLTEIAARLSDPKQDSRFSENLFDFDYVWMRLGGRVAGEGRNELLDWLLAMRGKLSKVAIFERWAQKKTAPWLVAALTIAQSTDRESPELVEAAAATSADAPEYATVAFHRLRLMEGKQSAEDRRILLDQIIVDLRRTSPPATLNSFLAQRFALARNLDEVFRYAPRAPGASTASGDEGGIDWPDNNPSALFDHDATKVLNRELPVSMWVAASESADIDDYLKNRILLSGWVRAELLGNESITAKLTPRIIKQIPAAADMLKDYQGAATPAAKRFAAVYFMLNAPGLRPHLRVGLPREDDVLKLSDFRDNWWCGSKDHYVVGVAPDEDQATPALPFLSSVERETAAREVGRLDEIGPAGNYFSKIAADWAQKNPRDPRAAEALYLAVRSTRYGCRDAGTGAASKLAFSVLKRLYPDSEWSKKTTHWYAYAP